MRATTTGDCILDAPKDSHVAELELCRTRIWMVVVQVDPVSQVIPINVGFNINTYLSFKMQYNISLQ